MADREAEEIAGRAVNSLDWPDVYAAARRRTLRDVTGTFYDEHLAREVAERLSQSIVAAARLQGWSECKEAAAKVAVDYAASARGEKTEDRRASQASFTAPLFDAVAASIRNLTPSTPESSNVE